MESENKIIIDLDNTLYPEEKGIFAQVNSRINLFMKEKMSFPKEDINRVRIEYMNKYGTTLRGLMINYNLKPDTYLDYVHDVEIESILNYDFGLDSFLSELKGEKVVFTNGSSFYARRIIRSLGVEKHFSFVFDIVSMDFIAKPAKYGYEKLLSKLKNGKGINCLFIDDRIENIITGKKIGMTTALVNRLVDAKDKIYADYVVERITDLQPLIKPTPFL